MSRFITMGFGGAAALVLTLGFSSAPQAQGGSYVTQGFGQTASKVVTLGLAPAPPLQGGSYVTFGQGQSASKFAMLGLRPGPAVVVVDQQGGGGRAFRIPIDDRLRRYTLQRDDELILLVAAAFVALN